LRVGISGVRASLREHPYRGEELQGSTAPWLMNQQFDSCFANRTYLSTSPASLLNNTFNTLMHGVWVELEVEVRHILSDVQSGGMSTRRGPLTAHNQNPFPAWLLKFCIYETFLLKRRRFRQHQVCVFVNNYWL
jgi:hypothetical protein